MLADVMISVVGEQCTIYDPSDPMHQDQDAIVALWKGIGNEIKCTSELAIHHLLQ